MKKLMMALAFVGLCTAANEKVNDGVGLCRSLYCC